MAPEVLSGPGRLPETRRIARVLDIVQHIWIAPEHWTRKSLAEKYEVSERQIQRDLDIIRYRLNLDLQRHRQGYYLKELPQLPVVRYTLSEALSLLLAAQAGREFGVDSAELGSAIGRLESVFPPEFRPLLRDLSATRHDDADSDLEAWLMVLHRALAARRKVRLSYASASREGEVQDRVVRPYCLFPKNRSWYLLGYCELRNEVRTFKTDRIEAAELLPDRYRIPDDFSLEGMSGAAWGLMWGAAGKPERVRLEFSPEAGRWVAEEEWHPTQEVRVLEGGRYEVRFEVGVTPEFVRWLLWYGRDVRVLEPAWLRQRVADEHQAAGEWAASNSSPIL